MKIVEIPPNACSDRWPRITALLHTQHRDGEVQGTEGKQTQFSKRHSLSHSLLCTPFKLFLPFLCFLQRQLSPTQLLQRLLQFLGDITQLLCHIVQLLSDYGFLSFGLLKLVTGVFQLGDRLGCLLLTAFQVPCKSLEDDNRILCAQSYVPVPCSQTTYNNEIQTHKRFKRMLSIRVKHNLQIFGAIPFIKLQNNT